MSSANTNKKIDALAASAKNAVARVESVVKGATAEAGTLLKKVDEGARQVSVDVTHDVQKLGVKAGQAVQEAGQKVEAVGEKLVATAEKSMKKTSEEM